MATAEAEFRATDVSVSLEKVDITDQAAVDGLFTNIIARHARIDVLANVAGIMDWFLPAHEVDDETWNRVRDVNLTGPMRLGRAVLPGMMERRAARSSTCPRLGVPRRRGGCGVHRIEARAHRVHAQRRLGVPHGRDPLQRRLPGGVETNIGTTSVPRSEWGIRQLAPIHAAVARIAKPDEITALISWLASGEASNVNGALVSADGGWSAG